MKKVVIFGAGDWARMAYIYLTKDSPYEVAAFTVHEAYLSSRKLGALDVVPFGQIEQLYPPDQFGLFVATGYSRVNKDRAAIYDECRSKGYELITYISSQATHWGEIQVGANCFILENSVIQPFATIGNNVVVGLGSLIGHDVEIGDHCFIGPGAVIPGGVKIGPYCFVGANATLRNGITIAPQCVIGAGAMILKDTKEHEVYFAKGTEAAPLRSAALGPYFGKPRPRHDN